MEEQRQIKFRVWDKLAKYMIYPNSHMSIDLNGNVYNLQNGAGGTDYKLMQFTGLLDKNGKEIYEEDIVKFYDYHNYEYIGYIDWGEYGDEEYVMGLKCLMIKPFILPLSTVKTGGISYSRGKDTNKILPEIIGNVFENPELLKQ